MCALRSTAMAGVCAAALLGGAAVARPDCSVGLTSHAFGSGAFGYELTVQRNAFLSRIYDVKLQIAPYEGYVDATASDGGGLPISATDEVYAIWNGDWPPTATRLVTAWSTAAHTCVTNAYVLFLAEVAGWSSSPYLSGNIAGYVRLPALAPAAIPDPAAEVTLSARHTIVPDPRLVGITPQTLSFAWETSATFRIETAWHTGEWSRVTNIFFDAPVTTWTSDVPLAGWGERFRAVLLAVSHDTNLLASAEAEGIEAPIARVEPSGTGAAVTLKTEPGARYRVGLYDLRRRPLDTATFTAEAATRTVFLGDGGVDGPVLARAQRLRGPPANP